MVFYGALSFSSSRKNFSTIAELYHTSTYQKQERHNDVLPNVADTVDDAPAKQ